MTVGSVHEYTIDWDALSQGERGITLREDSDSDGVFERTVHLPATWEYERGITLWVWVASIAASALVALFVAFAVSLGLRRKQA